MGVFKRKHEESSDLTDLNTERLRDKFEVLDVVRMNLVIDRTPVRVAGEVKRTVVAPRSGIPTLEVVISDGHGEVTAVFSGRRSIPGVINGRCLALEGVARPDKGRHIMMNPVYTILPS
jgi:hypothetical protein